MASNQLFGGRRFLLKIIIWSNSWPEGFMLHPHTSAVAPGKDGYELPDTRIMFATSGRTLQTIWTIALKPAPMGHESTLETGHEIRKHSRTLDYQRSKLQKPFNRTQIISTNVGRERESERYIERVGAIQRNNVNITKKKTRDWNLSTGH